MKSLPASFSLTHTHTYALKRARQSLKTASNKFFLRFPRAISRPRRYRCHEIMRRWQTYGPSFCACSIPFLRSKTLAGSVHTCFFSFQLSFPHPCNICYSIHLYLCTHFFGRAYVRRYFFYCQDILCLSVSSFCVSTPVGPRLRKASGSK